MRSSTRPFLITFLVLFVTVLSAIGQTSDRSSADLWADVDGYETAARRSLASQGKKFDSSAHERIHNEKRDLAKRSAADIAARTDLQHKDHYYLARLYLIADDDRKALQSAIKFAELIPSDAKGDMVESGLRIVVTLSSKAKDMQTAETAFERWTKAGGPPALQPSLQSKIAIAYFKDGKYDQAITHARKAFDLLKTLPPGSRKEKTEREKVYVDLIEVLALGYKKAKNTDQALEVLAEARAESFSLPSANLYRKVMTFVEGSGFSEKKMMQKVDSYASADPAPDIKLTEWIGGDAATLSAFRGKVVLLDFWATWCGPCISTFPRLRGWHKKYGGDDFKIVGITRYYGTQSGKRMSEFQELDFLNDFKKKHELPYALAVAPSGEAEMKYGINAFPTTVLLDRNGVVRYIGIGAGDEESENLEDSIKKVLKEKKTEVAEVTKPL